MDMQRTTYCPVAMVANLFDHVDHAINSHRAEVADLVAWASITGKPSTYTPTGHHVSHEDDGADEVSLTGLRGTTVYIDHIAENTGAHGIIFNHNAVPNADKTQNLGSTTYRWGSAYSGQFVAYRTSNGGFDARCYSSTADTAGALSYEHYEGTEVAPSAISINKNIGTIQWAGYDGSGLEYGARIKALASEGWTHAPEAHGTNLWFYTTAIGSDGPESRMYISSAGLSLINAHDLLSNTAGGSDIGTASNYFGNSYIETMYVDHVKERTGAHAIIFDNITKLGDASNYAQFAADGELTLVGTARVRKTIVLANAFLGKGTTAPTQVVLGNYTGWEFDINDDCVITHGVPKDWASGTDITIELSWYVNEAYALNSGEVKWEVSWSMCPHDGSEALDAPTHTGSGDSGDLNIPAVAKTLSENTVVTIAAASIAASDEIGLTLKRIALTAGANPTAKPTVIHVYIRYIANKLGTAT